MGENSLRKEWVTDGFPPTIESLSSGRKVAVDARVLSDTPERTMIGAINRANELPIDVLGHRGSDCQVPHERGWSHLLAFAFLLALLDDFGTNRVLRIRCITSLVSQDSSLPTLSWRPLVFSGSPFVKCNA